MKINKIVKFAVAAILCTCGCRDKAPLPVGSLTSAAVFDDDPNINFIKTWTYQVTPEVQMNVSLTYRPWLDKCDSMGCGSYAFIFEDVLQQSNGNTVWFDCGRVAEKIVDRDLVPKVENACASVHATAIAYWKQNNDPSEFTDGNGRVWKRQQ